jgi:hypothetical protein
VYDVCVYVLVPVCSPIVHQSATAYLVIIRMRSITRHVVRCLPSRVPLLTSLPRAAVPVSVPSGITQSPSQTRPLIRKPIQH